MGRNNSPTKYRWDFSLAGVRFLIIILLAIGVFFRFANIEKKVYWGDEAITFLRLSGYTQAEVVQQVLTGKVIQNEDLNKYRRINLEKSLGDTINSLAVEDYQHPPLYYVIARFWVQWFSNSVAATRQLSALISLFAFPCIYWLCLELFESGLVGGIAITLIAVSPFHVVYAQEAREYSLWTVTILLSSASLLRAIRLKTKFSWGIYAATVALGLYSFPLTGLVAMGHGIYTVVIEKFRLSKISAAYLLSSLAGFLLYTPWILVGIINLQQVDKTLGWTAEKLPLLSLVSTWTINFSRIFVDFLDAGTYFPNLKIPSFPLDRYKISLPSILFLSLLILVIYSIYFLCRYTPKKTWLFVLTLMGTTGLALILPDLLSGGQRSSVSRYVIPCYLGIQLAVGYLLATKISFLSANLWKQKLWQFITVLLVSGGVFSCSISSQASAWWNKYGDYYNPWIAHFINQTTYPLVISSSNAVDIGRVLSLSYLLAPEVQLQLVVDSKIPEIPNNFNNLFLFNFPETLQEELEKEYKIEPVQELRRFKSKLLRLERH